MKQQADADIMTDNDTTELILAFLKGKLHSGLGPPALFCVLLYLLNQQPSKEQAI